MHGVEVRFGGSIGRIGIRLGLLARFGNEFAAIKADLRGDGGVI
jgi:hypothetical protein